MTEPLEADSAQPHRRRRRLPLRWRIVAWFVASVAVALALVLGTGWAIMRNDIAHQANSDLSQEIGEFRRFTQQSQRTAPQVGASEVLEEFLSRQRPSDGELLVGYHHRNGGEVQNPGPGTDAGVLRQDGLLQRMLREPGGVVSTSAGELRWGRVDLVRGDERSSLVVVMYSGAKYQAMVDMFRFLVPIALLALLASGLIAWVIAGWILQPVRAVRRTAAEIGEHDLTRRLDVDGDDELADLAITFNAMLDRLELAFAAEHQFVDDAGHELRTPITVIRGHLELMGDDPAERRATLALVTAELDRMSRIVTDLLTLAKLDQPDYVQLKQVDVGELSLDLDAHLHAIPGRHWTLDHVADGPAVLDRERITQAVLQLATNAVQHTQEGDTVRLASRFVRDDEGRPAVELSVADSGPGVPDAEKSRLFDRFYRGAHGSDAGGAGLGLAIVAGIAAGHDGTVEVRDSPGGGATFVLTVPTRLAESGPHRTEREHEPDLFAQYEGTAR